LASLPATSFQCPADADEKAKHALKIDHAVKENAPAGWKSDVDGPKGSQILNALFHVMSRDKIATRAIFEIIKNQPGY
jgi:type I restriction enzyme R subunit